MPIDVVTGLPGNGKTAITVERMMAEAEKGERPIYAAGFDGLKVEGVTLLDDPRTWNDLDERGDRVVPDGALVYVDEAWKWFGHLHDASRAPTPKHVLDLAEHRHRGLDFVWTTQQPNQLYPFVRGLIGGHWHVVRRYGTQFLDVYRWEELNDDVKSVSRRENAEKQTRRLPEKAFDKYHSANVHTIKRRLPVKMIVMPLALVAGVALLWFAVQTLRPERVSEKLSGDSKPNAAGAASAASADGVQGRAAYYTTAEEYLTYTTPRIAAVPWTAPAFDGREVAADPRVYCMSTQSGLDGNGEHVAGSCGCLTEQGTAYQMAPATCRALARHGQAYNPFKQANDKGQGENRTDRESPRPREVAQMPMPSGARTEAQVASYGGIGFGPGVGASPR